jgi:PBP1b-binding outer membrane lipoprotein LpoB
MKKLFILVIGIMTFVGCTNDEITPEVVQTIKPELTIATASGIKLESTFTTVEVAINAKVVTAGKAVIKIYDISNRVVSKEEIDVVAGDNVLKVHTAILPSSAYRISLTDATGVVVGVADFNKL